MNFFNKKRLYSIIILLILFFSPMHAQMATIDVAAIATAIENGYTMYQNLQTAIKNMQMYAQQLQYLYDNAKSLNIEEIAGVDYASFLNSMGLSDEYSQKIRDVQSIIKNKSMTISGVNFSIEDLYTTDVYKKLGRVGLNEMKNMTEEEKIEFQNEMGITAEQAIKMNAVTSELNKTMTKSIAKLEAVEDFSQSIRDECANYQKVFENETSETALLQGMGRVMARNTETLTLAVDALNTSVEIMAKSQALENERNNMNVEPETVYEISKERQRLYNSRVGEENSYIGPNSFKEYE